MSIKRRTVLSAALLSSSAVFGIPHLLEPAHATPGYRFNNIFVFPPSNDSQANDLVNEIGGNPITFGHRLNPISASELPDPVSAAVKGKPYTVEGVGYIHRNALEGRDKVIEADGASWTVMPRGDGTVIVSSRNSNKLEALIKASANAGRTAYVGLPIPVMKKSEPWFPDLSYESVFKEFTRTAVSDLTAKGAKAFYLSTEMPLREVPYWNPVRRVYEIQNEAISEINSRSSVLVSPYFQKGDSPANAVRGAQSIMRTTHGVNLSISPQDGLGADTTSLEPRRGYVIVGEYFKALSQAIPNLQATVECMTPGGGDPSSRGNTTADMITRQIDAIRPYVTHISAFMWRDSASLKQVPGNEKFRRGTLYSPSPSVVVAPKPPVEKPAEPAPEKPAEKKPKPSSSSTSNGSGSSSEKGSGSSSDGRDGSAGSGSGETAVPNESSSPTSAPSKSPSSTPSATPSASSTESKRSNPYAGRDRPKLGGSTTDPSAQPEVNPSDGGGDESYTPPKNGVESSSDAGTSMNDIFPEGQGGRPSSKPLAYTAGGLGTVAAALVGANMFKKFRNNSGDGPAIARVIDVSNDEKDHSSS